MSTQELPEAPASITLSVVTTDGFPALLTLRETNGTALLKKVTLLEADLKQRGYKPQEKGANSFRKPVEYVEGVRCPQDGARLVIKKKQDGSPFWQCENKKWDSFKKMNTGTCNYTDWDAGQKSFVNADEPPMPENY